MNQFPTTFSFIHSYIQIKHSILINEMTLIVNPCDDLQIPSQVINISVKEPCKMVVHLQLDYLPAVDLQFAHYPLLVLVLVPLFVEGVGLGDSVLALL